VILRLITATSNKLIDLSLTSHNYIRLCLMTYGVQRAVNNDWKCLKVNAMMQDVSCLDHYLHPMPLCKAVPQGASSKSTPGPCAILIKSRNQIIITEELVTSG
jgi:hypothetical protein